MEATRELTRNEKLRVINDEVDRLDDLMRDNRRQMRGWQTENAQIDFLAGLRGSRSQQERERYNENKTVIESCQKTLAEAAKAIEKLYLYAEKELKTTLRAWY